MSGLVVDEKRLMGWIAAFGKIGALPGGGVCRLALSDADKEARDLLVDRMRGLDLAVSIDMIGNIWGVRSGAERVAVRSEDIEAAVHILARFLLEPTAGGA